MKHFLALAGCALWLGFAAPAAGNDDKVFLVVLGVAQDAGYPQAGCYREDCLTAWRNPARRVLVSSVAVVDGQRRYLFDATPDIGEQLFGLRRLAAGNGPPDGVFLTHGHVGHYTGLMHFGREAMGASGVPVYAMPRMRSFLENNGPWEQLVRLENIAIQPLRAGQAVTLTDRLRVTPFEVPHRDEYTETVGFRIDGPSKSAIYLPDIDKWQTWSRDVVEVVRSVDYALIDATFFADGELPGRDMSKIPHPFVRESMDVLEALTPDERARVLFIHMNHTNPLLQRGSDATREVERRGFGIARSGLILDL